MSEEMIVVEEELVEMVVSPAEASRRVVLAGIGIVVVASEEMKSAVNRLAERGNDGRPALPRPSLRRPLRKPVRALLTRLNIPTKTDIDALNAQVTTLLDKIERLQQREQPAQEDEK
jgi:hypothetical protein